VDPRAAGRLADEEAPKLDENDIKKYLPLFAPKAKEAAPARAEPAER
jgi:hypothetical protein